MTQTHRSWGRFAASLLALVAVVAGIPAFLAVCANISLGTPNPLPGVGSAEEIRTWFERELSTGEMVPIMLRTLLCVGWLLWTLLLASVFAAVVNSRPRFQHLAVPSLPVFDGFAGWVAAGLTMVSSFAPSATAFANQDSGPPLPDSVYATLVADVDLGTTTAADDFVPDGYVQVLTGESIQNVAQRTLGDPERWPELWELRDEQRDTANGMWSQPWRVEAGWQLRLPAKTATSIEDPSRTATTPETTPIPASTTPAKQYTVQANDGMWNVAEALLGDGSRHAELAEMFIGQEVAPGIVFSADTFVIHEGWVFTLAESTAADSAVSVTTDSHTVVVGDTLSKIAEQQLGDADAWPELFEENAGRQMSDGRTFDNPDLILPGWQIDVPNHGRVDAEEPTTPVEADATTPDSATGDSLGDGESSPVPERALDPHLTAPEAADRVDDVGTPGEPSTTKSPATPSTTDVGTVTPSTTTTTPPGSGSADQVDEGRPDQPSSSPSPIRIEHAALLAAGILALVGVRRRQRLRGAAARARVPEPPAEIVATERRLRTVDAGERSLRVDVAIRAAAHELVDTDAQIGVVLVDQDGCIDMRLSADAVLTNPWTAVDDDRQWWRLPAATPIELLGESARRVGTPCVALVQLGVADGRDVLVDVEACGTLAVVAPGGHAAEVVTALAAGLATSPYAEIAHLITVSVAEAAVVGHRNAHTATAPGQALELAASLVGSAATAGRSTFSLRSLRTGGEMWEPAIVLLGEVDGGPLTVSGTLPAPGRGVGLIASARHHELTASGTRLVGAVDGWKFIGFGTTIDIVPVGMDTAELAAVSELVEDASAPLVLTDELTWAGDVREVILDRDEFAIDADLPVAMNSETAEVDAAVGVAEATATPTAAFEPRPHRIMVRLMGGVEIVSHSDQPGTFERSKTVELVAWLATHRTSSTRSAARTALWELDVRDATFANVVSEARRALARLVTPPGDDEWVGRTLTERLPLHEGVVTDADLIEERLTAARLQPPAQAIETLTPAAELIRNIPFAGTSYLWPDAEGITSNLVLLATGVSTELAGHALSLGDIDLVFWATGQGLKVLPGHEELIGLRMQAHARAGDLAGVRQEWESYERVIVADAWSDGEPAPKLLALRHELLTTTA